MALEPRHDLARASAQARNGERPHRLKAWSSGSRIPSSSLTQKPRPVARAGLTAGPSSLAVLLAAAGPDEVEGLAVLDEVGVDRDGEARIVQLDREVVAALAGALRPGGPDLRVMRCTA